MKRPHPLTAIFAVVLADLLGLTLLIPLLPFYAQHYHASDLEVGLLFSCYALCQLVSAPLLGKWSDRTGRKPLLFLSQLGTVASLVLLARSEALWLVFVARIIDGLTAGNISLAQAYVADVTTPEERAGAFGRTIGIAFGIGFFIGPAISGVLYAKFGFTAPIYAAAGFSLVSSALTALLLPSVKPGARERESAPEQPPVMAESVRKFALRSRLTQMFLFQLGFALFTGGFALFAEKRYRGFGGAAFGTREVGYVLAMIGLVDMVEQGALIPMLVERLGEATLARFGFFLAAAGYMTMALTSSVPALLVGLFFAAVGTGAIRPALTSLLTQDAGPSEYGRILGMTESQTAIAQTVGPALAGLLIGLGLGTLWGALIAGALTLALAVPVLGESEKAAGVYELAAVSSRLTQSEMERTGLEERLGSLTAAVDEQTAKATRHEQRAEALERELSSATEERDRLQRELEDTERNLSELEKALEQERQEAQRTIEALNLDLMTQSGESHTVRQLLTAQARVTELKEKLFGSTRKLQVLEGALATAHRERARAQAELSALVGKVEAKAAEASEERARAARDREQMEAWYGHEVKEVSARYEAALVELRRKHADDLARLTARARAGLIRPRGRPAPVVAAREVPAASLAAVPDDDDDAGDSDVTRHIEVGPLLGDSDES